MNARWSAGESPTWPTSIAAEDGQADAGDRQSDADHEQALLPLARAAARASGPRSRTGTARYVRRFHSQVSPTQVGGGQLVFDLVGRADPTDQAVDHDRGEVGDAEHGAGELLDHEDRRRRSARSGRRSRTAPRRSAARGPSTARRASSSGRVGGQAAGHRQHLLLAARHRAGQLVAPLAEAREAAVGDRPRRRAQRRARVGHHAQVLAHGEVREDAAALGDACTRPLRASVVGLVAPLTSRPATCTHPRSAGMQAADHLQRGASCRRRSGRAARRHWPAGTTRSTPWSTSMRP